MFHKLPDGTYEPATITLEAVVQNVDNPKYQWGHIVGGSFRPYSVVYSHMIASPVHVGVVAVKVTGDNIPNAIIASETLTIVEDGVSPVQYKIVVKQLNRVVDSISCDAYGNPKIYYQATAYLYKITGNTEVLCEDFYCVVVYYKNGTQSDASVSTSPSGSYTFNVSGDYDLIHVGFIDSEAGKVIIDTSLAKVYDGAPAVQYSIDILQNGRPVNTIASDAEGYPKLEPTAFARLYKKVGNDERTICSDFYCKVVSINTDANISSEEESGVPVSDYEFEVADNYYDSFAVSFFDKTSKKTVAESSISRTFDGSTGESGYTYRSRGMFTTGETYVWSSEYRDIVFSWFNNKLYAFRVKNKGTSVTVPPTSSNGDDNWDDASELEFVATDLLLAQDAVVNVIGTSKIFIGELDKTEGWEMTKGAIKHTGTGLELTADGKLSAPKDGITIGTKSVEGMIDDVQVGGRNYVIGSGKPDINANWYMDGWNSGLSSAGNGIYLLHAINGWVSAQYKVDDSLIGQEITISCEVRSDNATNIYSFGFSNTKGYNPLINIENLNISTAYRRYARTFVLNDTGYIGFQLDLTAENADLEAKVFIRNLKIEKGNKATDWTPAPEDYVETGIDIQNRKIILQADTTEFRNNAGELITVFEDDKIKASMIDVDNLVAKKVDTAINGKRFVIDPSTNSLVVYDVNDRKVIEISFIDGTGNISSFPRIAAYGYDSNGNIQNITSMIYGGVACINYINGVVNAQTNIGPSGISVSSDSSNQSVLSRDGLRIFKNGSLYKSYT
ncbi:hypothetical protein BANORC5_06470 [Bacteroides nordii]|nr:hypothetical protein BANORC5_06470 [Bacteroides nordii]